VIGVVGGGAFGTALAVSLATKSDRVVLWSRRAESPQAKLPGVTLPEGVTLTKALDDLDDADLLLFALPMQALGAFLADHRARFDGRSLVLCCKGIDLATGLGPSALARHACPAARIAVLTGPSFAADIAQGLPTALTFASADRAFRERGQAVLSTRNLRLYRTDDVVGAEMGGALKNVVAIAAGVTIGAGLGHSARAAVITRGYAEMVRLAVAFGARAETLAGLSGFGDLVLTCTSGQSRNFRFGEALGAAMWFDPQITVEGAATATGALRLGEERRVDMPIASMVAALVDGRIKVEGAVEALLSRPLKEE
jgi:glycerol-3-phosphate dehydrogenase (NAD(P)+)